MEGTELLSATDLSVGYGGEPVCAPVTLSVAGGPRWRWPPTRVAWPNCRRCWRSPSSWLGHRGHSAPDVGVLGTVPVSLALLLGDGPGPPC
jgi:hypothetical protein